MSIGFDSYVEQAQHLEQMGDVEGAIEALRQAIGEDASNEEIRREIISLNLRKGDFQQVIVEYFDWAEICQQNGAIDDAIRIYQEILGLDTMLQSNLLTVMDQQQAEEIIYQIQETIQAASGAIFFNLGYLYLEKGALDEAISCLQKSLEFAPSDAKTHTLLGQVFMQKGLDKEAMGEFQEVVRLSPEEAAYAYEMLGEIFIKGGKSPQSTIVWFRNAGDLYVRHGQLEDALRTYERILSFEPKNKDVLTRLGEIYAQQGWKERAVEVFNSLAEIYAADGVKDKVLVIYEKIVEWDPDNPAAREKIIDIYRGILEKDPQNLSARSRLIGNILRKGAVEEAIPELMALSETYMGKGMRKESLAIGNKLLELAPDFGPAHELIADLLFDEDNKEASLKEYLAAIRCYKKAGDDSKQIQAGEKLSSKFPGSSEVAMQLANSYKEQGEYALALTEFQKLLAAEPDNVNLLISLLEVYEATSDADNFVATAHRIMELDPSRTDLADKIIALYEAKGDREKLLEACRAVLDSDPTRTDIREKMIEIYESLGNNEMILESYLKILEEAPGRTDIRQKLIQQYASLGKIDKVLEESSILADTFLGNNEIDRAEELYKNVLAFIPGDTTIRERLCDIYRQKGELEKVQEELVVLASINQERGDLSRAADAFGQLLEYCPDDINVKIRLARNAVKSGKKDEAVRCLQDIAELYVDKKMIDSALKTIEEIIEIEPENVEYRMKLIEILKEQSKTDEVIEGYKQLIPQFLKKDRTREAVIAANDAISIRHDDLELRKRLVEIFLEGDDAEDAGIFAGEFIDICKSRCEYQELVSIYDNISKIYRNKGQFSSYYQQRENIAIILEQQSKKQEAIEEYFNILEGDLIETHILDTDRLFNKTVELFFEEEQQAQAIEVFKILSEKLYKFGRLEESIMALEQVESIQERMGYLDQALDTLKQIIKYNSELNNGEKLIQTHNRRVAILLRQEEPEKAVDEIFEIIRYYLSVGNLEDAISQFEEAGKLKADGGNLTLRMAEALFDAEVFDNAKEMYERVLEEEPDNYDVITKVAIIFAKNGNLQDAASYIERIFTKGFVAQVIDEYKSSSKDELDEAQIHINLGNFYREMGFMEEAILEYQQASKDPGKLLDAYNYIALCFKKEGMNDLAVRQFELALQKSGYPEEDYLPVRYNLGQTYLDAGQIQDALTVFYECYMVDINYRDISEKINFLNERLSLSNSK